MLSKNAWVAAVALLFDEKIFADFKACYETEGLLYAMTHLIKKIAAAIGISWSCTFICRALESWFVLAGEETLTGLENALTSLFKLDPISLSAKFKNAFASGLLTAFLTVAAEGVRFAYHKVCVRMCGDSADRAGERADHEREASRIIELDNVLRHLLQISVTAILCPFVGMGPFALMAVGVAKRVVSYGYEAMLTKKREAGGWYGLFRPVLQFFGIVAPPGNRNYEWITDNGDDKASSIPQQLICPISHQLLVDPVKTSHGQYYSRRPLEIWLTFNQTNPLTRQPLDLTMVKHWPEMDSIVCKLAAHLNL